MNEERLAELPKESEEAIANRGDGSLSKSVLIISIDRTGEVQFCSLPFQKGKDEEPKKASLSLAGTIPRAKIKKTFRNLQWRFHRTSPCFVVIPSEDVLLLVEEFPTTDPNEMQTMAEGVVQGMEELEQGDYSFAFQVLSQNQSSTVCVLAIFQRERVEHVFKCLQKLGISNARFIIDLFADWLKNDGEIQNGFWGCLVEDKIRGCVIIKIIKIESGVIRAVRQRFYTRNDVDVTWVENLGRELFPEDFMSSSSSASIEITWHHIQIPQDMSQRLVDFGHQISSKQLPVFKLQPIFWKEHLQQQRSSRIGKGITKLLALCYGAFILYLSVFSIWQFREEKHLKDLFQQQESSFKEAMDLKRELATVRASLNPTGNVLEVLRQIVEPMAEGLVLDNFSYRFQDSVKLYGTAAKSEAVYDFVSKLQTNPLFSNSKVESIGENQGAGGVVWRVVVPLVHTVAPTTP